MTPIRFFIASVILVLIQNAVLAGDFESNARNYSLKGASFGMSIADFEKTIPNAKPVSKHATNANATYRVDISAERVGQFEFTHGRLASIAIIYTFEGDDRVDNENAVADQLAKVFGKPHRNDDAACSWFFPGVNRTITCSPSQISLIVKITDTAAK
jgi:hypothetical protein